MAHYTLPTVTGLQTFNLTPENRSALTSSPFTLKEQVLTYSGQRWMAYVETPNLNRDSADIWRAFLTKLNGPENTFSLGDPLSGSAKGSLGGTPVVDGGSQTGSTLNVTGATPSVTGWLLQGDYIQLGTGEDARLYMVTEDADTDGSGDVTLSLWPNLQVSPSDTDSVITSNPVGAFRLVNNPLNFNTNYQSQTLISFTAVSLVG